MNSGFGMLASSSLFCHLLWHGRKAYFVICRTIVTELSVAPGISICPSSHFLVDAAGRKCLPRYTLPKIKPVCLDKVKASRHAEVSCYCMLSSSHISSLALCALAFAGIIMGARAVSVARSITVAKT